MGSEGVEEGQTILAEAVDFYREVLGDRLVAAYALGSLAHGGFSPLVSDIDIGLILAHPLQASDAGTIDAGVGAMRAKGGELRQRLSVFWSSLRSLQEPPVAGRFPPLDRLDLIENGRLLMDQDMRQGLVRPDRAELVVAGAKFALEHLGDETVVEEMRKPQLLVDRGAIRLTKLVLFPVRFLFSAGTGRVGPVEAAVAHYLAADRPVSDTLVRAALVWRAEPPASLVAVPLLAREMLPLYLSYIDDHVSRLPALGRADLARAFEAWRDRLAR